MSYHIITPIIMNTQEKEVITSLNSSFLNQVPLSVTYDI